MAISDRGAVTVNEPECMRGFQEYFQEFTNQALTGPDVTYEEAIKAMMPDNHGKKLSDYYSDLAEYGL
ncbi:MAG: hypothetical protein FWH17_03575 [Oscillospiraceae bacterium]|nr:hypothetical protein [Oscillospiraceae bacterium]